jgi:hypothetical protein
MRHAWLVGSAGRTPFVGHLRGARDLGRVHLAWACCVAGTAGVVEGWEAAEAARDVFAELRAVGDPRDVLVAACAALARLDSRWLTRGDLTALLVATDGTSTRAAASGLVGLHAGDGCVFRPIAAPGHPLLGEPGAPDGTSHDVPLAEVWVGLPAGIPFPRRDVPAACGVRA